MAAGRPAEVRFLPASPAPIVPATDLGSVTTLKHGNVYLLADPFGDVVRDPRGLGLYVGDTRIMSVLALRLNGERPALLHASTGGNYRGTVHLTNPDGVPGPGPQGAGDGAAEARSLAIRRERILGNEALLEQLRLVNYAPTDQSVRIELGLGCDHADIFEVRGYPRPKRGESLPTAVTDARVTFGSVGLDACERRTHVAFSEAAMVGPAATGTDESLVARWSWTLHPGEVRELEWRIWLTEPGSLERTPTELFPDPPVVSADQGAAAYRAWTGDTTGVETDNEQFNGVLRRSVADLRLLQNDGPGPGERYVSAGVPWFATLFGRDAIITALQMLAFQPQVAIDTLAVLAARQATVTDDWRDAEPGKILHELRNGEMARSGELPFSAYYGTVDATPLWLVLLAATYGWTGDQALLDRYWPNALAALAWIDRWGDADADGFVEYGRRSTGGLVNQGWKDSADSVRDRQGVPVAPPIALAEVQGYVHDAKSGMAGLARLRGDVALAVRLELEAADLRQRFDAAFWSADQGFYAMALDGAKRPADAITSNAGHCLWSGIVPPERARSVADQLLAPPLFSGWGIRTYAEGQRGFNPLGYHVGTVWPHDTAIAAAGLRRYGFHEHANRLVGALFEAAHQFPDQRLPELFCGFARESTGAPVPYPVACSPQAWAAGSIFHLLQTMLGLTGHADRRELDVHQPHLPAWLGWVTITNLRVGQASVDLLVHRSREAVSVEVLRKAGDISVTIRP